MRGFPRIISNQHDIDNLMPLYEDKVKKYLKNVYDHKDKWLMTSKLADGDIGLTDSTHKVVEVLDDNDVVTERYQYEKKEDNPNGKLHKLGKVKVKDILGVA